MDSRAAHPQTATGKNETREEMSELAHTPTPWRVGPFGGIYPLGAGSMIASSDTKSGSLPRATENEAFIVEAVNAHDKLQAERDALLTALKKIIKMNRQTAKDKYSDADRAKTWSCVTVARAAIAAAEGKDTNEG